MKPRKRSLADFLAKELPTELQWRNRPPHGQAETAWCGRRFAWCVLHNVDALDLIRHDAGAKRATRARIIPSNPQPNIEGAHHD